MLSCEIILIALGNDQDGAEVPLTVVSYKESKYWDRGRPVRTVPKRAIILDKTVSSSRSLRAGRGPSKRAESFSKVELQKRSTKPH